MNIAFNSNRKPCTVVIKVQTGRSQKIILKVRDAYKKNSYYTNRWAHIKGKGVFYVRMPQSPAKGIIEIYNAKNGNLKKGQDKSFRVTSLQVGKVKTKLNPLRSGNKQLNNFVRFAQEFSERAPIISAGNSVYQSDDGQFRIDYLDVIRSSKDGKPMATPARISQNRGIIEVSKKYFMKYTIPMRMAILLHEYSHFYLNQKMEDEIEADLNAMLVYLSLGYPRIEAHEAFLEVFKGSPSNQNVVRYQTLKNFITSYDSKNFNMRYKDDARRK